MYYLFIILLKKYISKILLTINCVTRIFVYGKLKFGVDIKTSLLLWLLMKKLCLIMPYQPQESLKNHSRFLKLFFKVSMIICM